MNEINFFYNLLRYTQVPPRIIFDLETLELKDYPDIQKDLQANGSIYLFGEKGGGKSTIACHILAKYIKSLYPKDKGEWLKRKMDFDSPEYDPGFIPFLDAYFCWFPNYLEEVKKTFQKKWTDSPKMVNQMDKCLHSKILILDDIGVEKTTDWSFEMLYLIVGHRYNHMLPTIFTSNVSLADLGRKLGDTRVPSRIEGMCGKNIYKISDKDYRRFVA